MKRTERAAALLLALLLLTAPVRAAEHGAAFTDVPETHWAYESIRLAAQYGLVTGLDETTFGLGRSVTRAQYAAMLCRLMGWETVSPAAGSFSDNQDRNTWYYAYIETAAAHGALLKLSGVCEPNEALPREELAAMTVRALGYAPLAGIVQDDCSFDDVTTNPGYIELAYRMGFMNGVGDQRFSPKTSSTREQAAAVLLRVYDRLHGETTLIRGTAPANAVAVQERQGEETPIPMSPRAPLENVYAAAVRAGVGGAVVLSAAPFEQIVRGSAVSGLGTIGENELDALLKNDSVKVYRSARYLSSYLLYPGKDGSTTVVWFESEEDVTAKVELCRLMGVSTVYLQ